jgi:hypothetical protein
MVKLGDGMNIYAKSIITLFIFFLGSISCQRDHIDICKCFLITSNESFLLSNLNVLRIEPNGHVVLVIRKGHNVKKGNAFLVPWEELEAVCGSEKYIVNDKNTGNEGLFINGRIYKSGIECMGIVIKFGEGVLIDQVGEEMRKSTQKPIPLVL